ncbi:MAG: type II toxin-antitoxin system RelE/ParE family toxin [Alphaproteobacteria bacterium]|nr:type II toxin-antitoxin system RelE/ParE family toxin [Alphaproteobacteria bacterium]
MKIVWSPSALADLEDAWEWTAQRDVQAARDVVGRLLRAVEKLARAPLDGPPCVLTNGEEVRRWPVGRYTVFYQRRAEGFYVVRVYHQRRRPIVR